MNSNECCLNEIYIIFYTTSSVHSPLIRIPAIDLFSSGNCPYPVK